HVSPSVPDQSCCSTCRLAGSCEITMPVRSVPVRDPSLPVRVLQQYLVLLKKYPVLTKSVTSGILSALGNLLSQALESKKKRKEGSPAKEVDLHGPVRFAVYGLVITGPISHYFYYLLEALFPAAEPYCMLKRLLLERLVFAPAFLMLFFVVMNALEGKTTADLQDKVQTRYWPALKMNWKVWTPFQFININYVPVQVSINPVPRGMCTQMSLVFPDLCFPLSSVPGAVCEPDRLVLVRLPRFCQEVNVQVGFSEGKTTADLQDKVQTWYWPVLNGTRRPPPKAPSQKD
ncbi:hypothetical protein NFI96_025617, partial [Prochilodus magdalenae]